MDGWVAREECGVVVVRGIKGVLREVFITVLGLRSAHLPVIRT